MFLWLSVIDKKVAHPNEIQNTFITFVFIWITGIGLGSINSFGSKTDQAQRTNGNVLVAKGQTTKQWYHQWTPITAAARNHA